ncbi:MAG: PAS domain-containing protein, partial [Anaerolineales bacterium]|nr:PAS domain-containing protein [Anaerolineales bacterium]
MAALYFGLQHSSNTRAERNMKIKPSSHSIIIRYVFLGIMLGLMFPILGTILQINISGLPFTWVSAIHIQRSQPLLWVIDTAPLFLGLAIGLAGFRQRRVTEMKSELEKIVQQRTEELASANTLLKTELDVLRQLESIVERGKKEWDTTFDTIVDLIFLTDAQGNIIRCNKAVNDMLSNDYNNLIGKPIFEILGIEKTVLDANKKGELELPLFKGCFELPKTIEEAVRLVLPQGDRAVALYPFGKKENKTVAVISGGGPFDVFEAIAQGIDLYITG